MSNSNEDSMSPDNLPDVLIQRIDALELPKLKSLLLYIEQRIESLRTPIEEEIEASAAGEILDIENHGSYALVRKHLPDPEGPGADTDITSLYHVRWEQQLDGPGSLHWAYLGDVHDPMQIRCETCGRTLEEDVASCPYCGSDDSDNQETEG